MPHFEPCLLAPQIGFGSGFKCNSAVWRALRNVKQEHGAWKHVQGRESEALERLRELGLEREKVSPQDRPVTSDPS